MEVIKFEIIPQEVKDKYKQALDYTYPLIVKHKKTNEIMVVYTYKSFVEFQVTFKDNFEPITKEQLKKEMEQAKIIKQKIKK